MNICALIVTYNRLDKLKHTIEATLKLPFQSVVIVNNASTDGTDAWLNSIADHRLHIVNNEVNSGGAGGFKIGAKYVREKISSDWVLFYDDDAWPEKDFITNFENLNHTNVDVFCSMVVDLDSEICKMNVPWVKVPRSFRETLEYSKSSCGYVANTNISTSVMTFSFVGCVIKSEVLNKTYNLIDETLFIYFDDVYYSYQLHKAGFKLRYEPLLLFYHDVQVKKNNTGQEWKVYYLIRNMILSLHHNDEPAFFSKYAILARLLKHLIAVIGKKGKIQYLKYFCKGFYHGLRNVKGKYI